MQASMSIMRRPPGSRVDHRHRSKGSRVSRAVKDSIPTASNSTAISGTRMAVAVAVATGEGASALVAAGKVARADKPSNSSSPDRRRSSFPIRQPKGGSIRRAMVDLFGGMLTATWPIWAMRMLGRT